VGSFPGDEERGNEFADALVDGLNGWRAVEDLDPLASRAGVGDGLEVILADALEGGDLLVALGLLVAGELAAERTLRLDVQENRQVGAREAGVELLDPVRLDAQALVGHGTEVVAIADRHVAGVESGEDGGLKVV
jgi:hypothetical protein